MVSRDVKTNSARLVQTEANGQILDKLSEAGVWIQVPGRATDANITASSDANWASTASDTRSTCGGVLMHWSHRIKSCSKAQSLVALSSGESELYAFGKASASAMSIQSVIRDLGQSWSTVVYSNASAALVVIQRQGLESLRHMDYNYLIRAELARAEVLESDNHACICTKGLNVELMTRHVSAVDGRYSAGRPTWCPEVLLEYRIQCAALGRGSQLSSAVC